MNDSFYRAFEDRHRGSRALITARLGVYTPFFTPLTELYPRPAAIDLGCGRGEWLELLGNAEFDACGVDLDDGMLAACRERGLNATLGDALEALRALSAESMTLVSAFHVVEHLPFDTVRLLVQEALRVLKPGGLLILETPNPENLVVGASEFYLDPSHQRPIPPQLLSFAVEYAGFSRNKIVRLQEAADLHSVPEIRLLNVLGGVSPDYSVVAQKSAPPEVLARFDAPFNASYGLLLETLAQRYDLQAEHRHAAIHRILAQTGQQITELHQSLAQAETRAVQRHQQTAGRIAPLEARVSQGETQLAQLEARIAQTEDRAAQSEVRAAQSEARATQSEARAIASDARAEQLSLQLLAVLQSRSWRMTAPYRQAGGFARRFVAAAREGRLGSGTKRRIQSMLRGIGHVALRQPRLKQAALWMLNRAPGVKQQLRDVMREPSDMVPPIAPTASEPSPLSPRAQRIHAELKKAIDARKS